MDASALQLQCYNQRGRVKLAKQGSWLHTDTDSLQVTTQNKGRTQVATVTGVAAHSADAGWYVVDQGSIYRVVHKMQQSLVCCGVDYTAAETTEFDDVYAAGVFKYIYMEACMARAVALFHKSAPSVGAPAADSLAACFFANDTEEVQSCKRLTSFVVASIAGGVEGSFATADAMRFLPCVLMPGMAQLLHLLPDRERPRKEMDIASSHFAFCDRKIERLSVTYHADGAAPLPYFGMRPQYRARRRTPDGHDEIAFAKALALFDAAARDLIACVLPDDELRSSCWNHIPADRLGESGQPATAHVETTDKDTIARLLELRNGVKAAMHPEGEWGLVAACGRHFGHHEASAACAQHPTFAQVCARNGCDGLWRDPQAESERKLPAAVRMCILAEGCALAASGDVPRRSARSAVADLPAPVRNLVATADAGPIFGDREMQAAAAQLVCPCVLSVYDVAPEGDDAAAVMTAALDGYFNRPSQHPLEHVVLTCQAALPRVEAAVQQLLPAPKRKLLRGDFGVVLWRNEDAAVTAPERYLYFPLALWHQLQAKGPVGEYGNVLYPSGLGDSQSSSVSTQRGQRLMLLERMPRFWPLAAIRFPDDESNRTWADPAFTSWARAASFVVAFNAAKPGRNETRHPPLNDAALNELRNFLKTETKTAVAWEKCCDRQVQLEYLCVHAPCTVDDEDGTTYELATDKLHEFRNKWKTWSDNATPAHQSRVSWNNLLWRKSSVRDDLQHLFLDAEYAGTLLPQGHPIPPRSMRGDVTVRALPARSFFSRPLPETRQFSRPGRYQHVAELYLDAEFTPTSTSHALLLSHEAKQTAPPADPKLVTCVPLGTYVVSGGRIAVVRRPPAEDVSADADLMRVLTGTALANKHVLHVHVVADVSAATAAALCAPKYHHLIRSSQFGARIGYRGESDPANDEPEIQKVMQAVKKVICGSADTTDVILPALLEKQGLRLLTRCLTAGEETTTCALDAATGEPQPSTKTADTVAVRLKPPFWTEASDARSAHVAHLEQRTICLLDTPCAPDEHIAAQGKKWYPTELPQAPLVGIDALWVPSWLNVLHTATGEPQTWLERCDRLGAAADGGNMRVNMLVSVRGLTPSMRQAAARNVAKHTGPPWVGVMRSDQFEMKHASFPEGANLSAQAGFGSTEKTLPPDGQSWFHVGHESSGRVRLPTQRHHETVVAVGGGTWRLLYEPARATAADDDDEELRTRSALRATDEGDTESVRTTLRATDEGDTESVLFAANRHFRGSGDRSAQ